MSLQRRADPLRQIAARLALPTLAQIAKQPGIGDAWRLTIQYHDAQHPDQVATIAFRQGAGGSANLTLHYRRADDRPFMLAPHVPLERCREFTLALRALKFDTLDDMPDLPWFGADLWLVERASGGFHHDVVLAPDRATDVYGSIVSVVHLHLKEALRAIRP